MDEMALGHVFLRVLRFRSASIVPPVLHPHSFLYHRRYTVSATDSVIKHHT